VLALSTVSSAKFVRLVNWQELRRFHCVFFNSVRFFAALSCFVFQPLCEMLFYGGFIADNEHLTSHE
jgi:hypothetical protein